MRVGSAGEWSVEIFCRKCCAGSALYLALVLSYCCYHQVDNAHGGGKDFKEMRVVNGYCFYQMLLQEQDLCTKSYTCFSLWAGAQTICCVYPYPYFCSLFHVLSMSLGYFIFCSLT